MNDAPTAEFAPRNFRLWLWTFIGLSWIGGAIAIQARHPTPIATVDGLVGILLGLVVSAFAIGCLVRILRGRPAVVVRRDGFEDNAGMFPMGFVPWSEVTSLVLYGTKRSTMRVGWPPVAIPQAMVAAELAVVRAAMSEAANATRAVDRRVEVVDRILETP